MSKIKPGKRASLLRLVDLAEDSSIVGRAKLQKTVFLIQQLINKEKTHHEYSHFQYNYELYLYGVFSKSLAMDISYVSSNTHFLDASQYNNGWKYTANIKSIKDDLPSSEVLFGEVNEQYIKDSLNSLVKNNTNYLEALSTIVYLVNEREQYKYEIDTNSEDYKNLKKEVLELKPHVKNEYESAFNDANKYIKKEKAN
jgi:hypothetical protein